MATAQLLWYPHNNLSEAWINPNVYKSFCWRHLQTTPRSHDLHHHLAMTLPTSAGSFARMLPGKQCPWITACSYKLKSIYCGQGFHLPSLAAPSGGYSGNWPSEGTLTVRRRQRPLVASTCGSWTPSIGTCVKRKLTAVNVPPGYAVNMPLDKDSIIYSSGNNFQMQFRMPALTTQFLRLCGQALQWWGALVHMQPGEGCMQVCSSLRSRGIKS